MRIHRGLRRIPPEQIRLDTSGGWHVRARSILSLERGRFPENKMGALLRNRQHTTSLRRLICLLAVFCIVALAATPALAGLHPGDKLDVVVFDHPELSGPVTVSSDGGIFVALVGRVQALGLEPQTVARDIERRMASYVFSPAVDVRVVSESNIAYFVGAINSSLTLHPSETLAMALGDAKIPDTADLSRVTIRRTGTRLGPFDMRALQTGGDTSPMLASGDAISVPNKPVMVGVGGAVKAPATVYLASDEPLGLALQNAQFADDANLQRIQLQRAGHITVTARNSALLNAPGQNGDQLTVPHFATVTVLGFAAKPGPVTLKGNQTLATALTQAGGAAKDADLGRIVVVSGDGSGREKVVDYNAFTRGIASANPELSDGDFVYVPKQLDRISSKTLLTAALIAAKKAGLNIMTLLK